MESLAHSNFQSWLCTAIQLWTPIIFVLLKTDCGCDPKGSSSMQCQDNGKCSCKDRVEGDKCDSCKPDHTDFPNCHAMNGKNMHWLYVF